MEPAGHVLPATARFTPAFTRCINAQHNAPNIQPQTTLHITRASEDSSLTRTQLLRATQPHVYSPQQCDALPHVYLPQPTNWRALSALRISIQ